MAEFAALPVFTDSWIADTAHLPRLARGLYWDLLVLMWRTPECRVPNEIEWISYKLNCAPDERDLLQKIISEFCTTTGNWVTQKRLMKEFNYVRKNTKKQSDAAKSRWNKEKKNATASANPMPQQESRHASGNAPSPSPSPSPSSSSKDDFQLVDDALRKIPGIEKHPVAIAPVIAPIWQLVESGYDLRRQIIPSIARQLKTLNGSKSITAWKYFVPGIVDDAKAAMPAGANPAAVDDAKWGRLLENARNGPNGFKGRWDVKNYGPAPNQPGCRVPTALLKPGDGEGWTEWKPEP